MCMYVGVYLCITCMHVMCMRCVCDVYVCYICMYVVSMYVCNMCTLVICTYERVYVHTQSTAFLLLSDIP